jgi:hypothetical protein
LDLTVPPEIRLHDAAVPVRHISLTQVKRDVAYEIPVDVVASDVMTELPFWTSTVGWMRIKIGAGVYSAVGATRATAVDLGAFTAEELKECTIEVKVPTADDDRQDVLALNLGYGL